MRYWVCFLVTRIYWKTLSVLAFLELLLCYRASFTMIFLVFVAKYFPAAIHWMLASPLKIHTWEAHRTSGRWWGTLGEDEVMRVEPPWWDQCPHQRPRALPAPPEGHSRKTPAVPQEEVLTSPGIHQSLGPGRPACRTMRSKYLLLTGHLGCGVCYGSSNGLKPVCGDFLFFSLQ